MKKLSVLLMLALVAMQLQAQQYKYYVQFSDKDGSPYSLSEPTAFLSQRSLDRRSAKGIPLDSLDLPVNPSYVQQAAAAVNATVRYTLRWMNGAVIATPTAINTAILTALPFVDTAFCVCDSPDGPFGENLSDVSLPGENYSPDEPFSDKWYGNHWITASRMGGDKVNRAGYTGAGVMVGIICLGYYKVDEVPALARLRDEGRIVATRDFDNPDRSIYEPHHERGTCILQNMAAYNPGHYVGCAYDASYVLVAAENDSYEQPVEAYNLVAAYEYLDSIGADMVVNDLFYKDFDMPEQSFLPSQLDGSSTFLSSSLNTAADKGMAFFCNVLDVNLGNFNAPNDALGVMIVGAIHGNGDPQEDMMHGPTIDGRIKPDVCIFNDGCLNYSGRMIFKRFSFSVGNVASLAACALQKHPEWTSWQLLDSIRSWGSNAATPNNAVGWGETDFSKMLSRSEVGIDEPQAGNSTLRIYPNPATEMVTIAGNVENATVEILDMLGRTMLERKVNDSNETKIDVSTFAPGLYIVRIRNANGDASDVTRSMMVR